MSVKVSNPHPQVLSMNTTGKRGCPVTEEIAAVTAWAAHTKQHPHIPIIHLPLQYRAVLCSQCSASTCNGN